ncbi:MAG TPA: hypothetical protein VFN22_11295 [Gemmatimonadales bacterium]|nr:hypothetical protein [Gemmatimonadales bacterium]
MIRHLSALALASLILAGCGDKSNGDPAEKPISAIEAFPNVPFPPNGVTVGKQGNSDALELQLKSPEPDSSVAEFYRQLLAKPPYRLINESATGGVTTFYVESDANRPLWIHVQADSTGGTLVRLVGTARPKADSGS